MQLSEHQIEQFRLKLGDAANQLTDQEVEAMCAYAYELANVLIDHWLETKKQMPTPET